MATEATEAMAVTTAGDLPTRPTTGIPTAVTATTATEGTETDTELVTETGTEPDTELVTETASPVDLDTLALADTEGTGATGVDTEGTAAASAAPRWGTARRALEQDIPSATQAHQGLRTAINRRGSKEKGATLRSTRWKVEHNLCWVGHSLPLLINGFICFSPSCNNCNKLMTANIYISTLSPCSSIKFES
ncbi:hypothetical protein FOCC_FOCC007929 [Frankliniella occidentalis]|nr:hypothetical protein FOCC_FOCC007929 [Frankliniella occidentalis]